MRTGIVSDIHGNIEAFETVLANMDKKNVDRIICLGDILGYGPDPVPCVDRVIERCEWSIMGNHDFGALYEPTNFNAAAEAAAYWTRDQFEAEADSAETKRRWQFLGRLPVRVMFGNFLCVHGSPRRPINEYIFPEDAINSPVKMQQLFDRIPNHCFVGHTHVPGVFTDEPDFYHAEDLDGIYKFNDQEKTIINPGSVGQPRDLDPRASYAIYDEDQNQVEFYRLEYDFEKTISKIAEIPELNDWLGERLREGR